MEAGDVLDLFLPPVREWFRRTLGEPTPPQRLGWPAIASGQRPLTTPESLHLLLTSRGRDMLGGVTHCIVDEIHAVCGNKRGVFLSLLLERLAALNSKPFVRIGLSATQRPLEEVARYLGGLCEDE